MQELTLVKEQAGRQLALDQLVAKLQRKKQRLKGPALYRFNTLAGMAPDELTQHLKSSSPEQAAQWFTEHPLLLDVLEERSVDNRPLLVSDHHDELLRVERGYGKGNKPDDYLEAFERYVRSQLNQLPALVVVAHRPRELSREWREHPTSASIERLISRLRVGWTSLGTEIQPTRENCFPTQCADKNENTFKPPVIRT